MAEGTKSQLVIISGCGSGVMLNGHVARRCTLDEGTVVYMGFGRLSDTERAIVGQALRAAAHGLFFPIGSSKRSLDSIAARSVRLQMYGQKLLRLLKR